MTEAQRKDEAEYQAFKERFTVMLQTLQEYVLEEGSIEGCLVFTKVGEIAKYLGVEL